MTEPDPREAKLPVWARRELSVLRHTVQHQRNLLAEVDRSEAVMFRDWYDDFPIPAAKLHDPVYAALTEGERRWISFQVNEHRGERTLEVMGSHPLVVRGRASNAFTLGVDND